jgi:formate dehydrogenase major subunit
VAIRLDIDGRSIEVGEGTTLYDAAASAGIAIRRLCHDPKLAPVGMCRLCAVEVEGERVLAASCVRRAESGTRSPPSGRPPQTTSSSISSRSSGPTPPASLPARHGAGTTHRP